MKQAALVLKGFDLEIFAEGLELLLLGDHKLRSDQWNRRLLDLSLQMIELPNQKSASVDVDIHRAPWVSEFLRRALRDAGRIPALEQLVKELQLDLKAAKKPAPRPKRRPVKKAAAPATAPEPATAFPAPRTMAEVNAALGEQL